MARGGEGAAAIGVLTSLVPDRRLPADVALIVVVACLVVECASLALGGTSVLCKPAWLIAWAWCTVGYSVLGRSRCCLPSTCSSVAGSGESGALFSMLAGWVPCSSLDWRSCICSAGCWLGNVHGWIPTLPCWRLPSRSPNRRQRPEV